MTRLRETERQVRGLLNMIRTGTWRPDVNTQTGSVTRVPPEVATGLLDEITGAIRQVIRL